MPLPTAEQVQPSEPQSVFGRFFWAVLNAGQIAFMLLWTAACISVALVVLTLTRRPALALGMARRPWAPGVLCGAGARLEVEGAQELESGTPYLFASSHQSLLDTPVLFAALPAPLRFVVKRELGRVPFLGWYIAALGMVAVDRGAQTRAVASLRRVTALLRSGASVVCFPEGTRSRDGAVAPFKSALFAMAIEAGVPVVPVAVTGTGAVLPAAGFRIRPGTVRVRVGRPIPTRGLTTAQRGELAQRVHDEVVRLAAADNVKGTLVVGGKTPAMAHAYAHADKTFNEGKDTVVVVLCDTPLPDEVVQSDCARTTSAQQSLDDVPYSYDVTFSAQIAAMKQP